jgi:hypothetical protein
LYGISEDKGFDALKYADFKKSDNEQLYSSPQAYIRDKALFGLTWDGFWLKSNHGDGYVSISYDRDFEVIKKTENGEVPII